MTSDNPLMMSATALAQALGARRVGKTYRCDCPACFYRQAFSIRQGQNGRALLKCMNGCEWETLLAALRHFHVDSYKVPPRHDDTNNAEARQRQKQAALRVWSGAVSAIDSLGDCYLANARALPGLAASNALRFRADTRHPEGGSYPALIALATDVAGQPIAIHRTYLAADGSGKAAIQTPRATKGAVWGGAIRLQPYDPEKPLVVGEGIESSASAGVLIGAPAWAAVSAGNLGRGLILPPEVRDVIIAADPDRPGEAAALQAADRWKAEDRNVQIARPTVDGDFNDILCAGGANHG